MKTYTRYHLVPLRAVSWCASTGEACEWQYANSSRPSFSECEEDIPRNADEDHRAIGAVQQQFGAVVAIIEDIDRDGSVSLTAVVSVDFEFEQCGCCGAFGIITKATHELKYRRESKEEKEFHQFLCSECVREIGSEGILTSEDYDKM